MKKISNTTYVLGFSIFVFLICIAGLSYEVYNKNLDTLGVVEIERQAALYQKNNQAYRTIGTAKIKEIETKGDQLGNFFLKRDDLVGFLDFIESLGQKTGAQIKIDSISESKVGDKTQIALSVRMDGSFSGVYRTIRLLEEMPYQSRIIGYNIDKISSDKKGQFWGGSINFVVPLF